MTLQRLLQAIRSFAVPEYRHNPNYGLLPSKHNPQVDRWQRIALEGTPGRSASGRFARGVQPGTLPRIAPPPEAKAEIEREQAEVEAGQRSVYRDKTTNHLVTTARSYPPINTSTVRDLSGRPVEPVLLEMMHPKPLINGFTLSHANGDNSAPPRTGLWYSYYSRGVRPENGRANLDHLKDVSETVLPQFKGHFEPPRILHTVGHVFNEGWPLEDHMERIHLPEPLPQDPYYARGIEQSQQASLLLRPKREDSEVLKDLAQAIEERAKQTDYRWWYPDLRVFGAGDIPGFETHPMLYIPGRGGFYGTLAKSMPESLTSLFPHSRIMLAQVPAGWHEILKDADDSRLEEIRSYQSRRGFARLEGVNWLDELQGRWASLKSGRMSPEQAIALYDYAAERQLGASPQTALAIAAQSLRKAQAAMSDAYLRQQWASLGHWYEQNGLGELDFDRALAKLEPGFQSGPATPEQREYEPAEAGASYAAILAKLK